jgi:hypothetical protein
MRKLLLSSAVALVALSSAALAGERNYFSNSGTSSVEGNISITKSFTKTRTTVNKDQFDNYNGIGTYTSAEHGGVADIKTAGKAGAKSFGLNAAVANANGVQGSVDLSAGLNANGIPGVGAIGGALNANLTGTALQAGSTSVSGSGLVANAQYGGSVKATSAGYAQGSAVAQREWGNSHTYSTMDQTNVTRNLTASGTISRTR